MRAENTANQQEDKRAFKKFIVIILLAAMGGAILGVCSIKFARAGSELVEAMTGFIRLLAPWTNLVLGTVILLVTRGQSGRFGRLYAGWDGDDEALAGQMEDLLTAGMAVTAVGQILSYFFFALGFWALDLKSDEMPGMLLFLLVIFGGFAYTTVVNIKMQKRFVDGTKRMNPEKQGSVYDTKFQKRWMESCDEMERMQIYQAAYHSYRVTLTACIICWVICFVGMVSWNFGLLPIVVTTALWMVLCVSYIFECVRISKRAAAKLREET